MSSAGDMTGEVLAVIARMLAVEQSSLTPETSIDELPADSLKLMEVMGELEQQLGVELPESNAFVTSLQKVSDIVEAVEQARPDR
jgi:acyl carrier protein